MRKNGRLFGRIALEPRETKPCNADVVLERNPQCRFSSHDTFRAGFHPSIQCANARIEFVQSIHKIAKRRLESRRAGFDRLGPLVTLVPRRDHRWTLSVRRFSCAVAVLELLA